MWIVGKSLRTQAINPKYILYVKTLKFKGFTVLKISTYIKTAL